jgi:hypothetical protein
MLPVISCPCAVLTLRARIITTHSSAAKVFIALLILASTNDLETAERKKFASTPAPAHLRDYCSNKVAHYTEGRCGSVNNAKPLRKFPGEKSRLYN